MCCRLLFIFLTKFHLVHNVTLMGSNNINVLKLNCLMRKLCMTRGITVSERLGIKVIQHVKQAVTYNSH